MKINSIKNIYNFYSKKQPKAIRYYRMGDYCCSQINSELNTSSIDKIPTILKFLLRRITPTRIKEMAQLNLNIANKIKVHFDNKYGKNNYALISIGRSVASIVETAKELGMEAYILPLSGLKKGLPQNIPNLDLYKKYLAQIGLNKEKLDKFPNKKYVLIDYTSSGNSLETAKKLFEQYLFPNNKGQIVNTSINKILELDKNLANKNIDILFCFNRFKLYSPVGKLDITNLEQCFEQSNPKTSREYNSKAARYIRKIFLFNVYDRLKQQKRIKITPPKKELDATYKHYLTNQAIESRANMMIQKQRKQMEEIIKINKKGKS